MRNGIKDFVPHYVEYCDKREDFIDLLRSNEGEELAGLSFAELSARAEKPIRHTWPGLLNRHKKPSYRYYDFTDELNTAFQFKTLFRRIRAKDTEGKEVISYKKLSGDAAKVTLAARRLKRDKIINKDTGTSVDALWCPPLIWLVRKSRRQPVIHGPGNTRKKKQKKWPKGNAGVSFSLMASPLPGDPWMKFAGDALVSAPVAEPVHLTVSFKIEGAALASLENEGVFRWRVSAGHRGRRREAQVPSLAIGYRNGDPRQKRRTKEMKRKLKRRASLGPNPQGKPELRRASSGARWMAGSWSRRAATARRGKRNACPSFTSSRLTSATVSRRRSRGCGFTRTRTARGVSYLRWICPRHQSGVDS